MAFSYDPTSVSSNRDRVRLLIKDTLDSNYVFEDEELDAFLTLESSSLKRAAALAYEVIAGNQAYVLKVIKNLDLQTDGAKVAEALRATAKAWRDQAEYDDAAAAGGAFDIAEWLVDDFSQRDYDQNLWLETG